MGNSTGGMVAEKAATVKDWADLKMGLGRPGMISKTFDEGQSVGASLYGLQGRLDTER